MYSLSKKEEVMSTRELQRCMKLFHVSVFTRYSAEAHRTVAALGKGLMMRLIPQFFLSQPPPILPNPNDKISHLR